jgi:TfoX/Sxy family transcriptional regulator of competence genes
MAYNKALSDRIREALADLPKVEEKEMFGGMCFMVNDKMCVGVMKEDMMCRIDPELKETVLEMEGCRPMTMGGKTMNGYVLISEEGMKSKKEFDYWIGLCLEFNPLAKASKKTKKKS